MYYNTYSLPEYEEKSKDTRMKEGLISAAPAAGTGVGALIGGGLGLLGGPLAPLTVAGGAALGGTVGGAAGSALQGILPGMLGTDEDEEERARRNDQLAFQQAQKMEKDRNMENMMMRMAMG